MPKKGREKPVVFDSSSLIELERMKELRILSYVRVCVPEKVAEEVNQKGSDLARWINKNRNRIARMLPAESRTYMGLMVQSDPAIDDGEAVAIAIASHRGLELVIEDGAGRKAARNLGLSVLHVPEFIERVRLL